MVWYRLILYAITQTPCFHLFIALHSGRNNSLGTFGFVFCISLLIQFSSKCHGFRKISTLYIRIDRVSFCGNIVPLKEVTRSHMTSNDPRHCWRKYRRSVQLRKINSSQFCSAVPWRKICFNILLVTFVLSVVLLTQQTCCDQKKGKALVSRVARKSIYRQV